jgi:hypothetical protein
VDISAEFRAEMSKRAAELQAAFVERVPAAGSIVEQFRAVK